MERYLTISNKFFFLLVIILMLLFTTGCQKNQNGIESDNESKTEYPTVSEAPPDSSDSSEIQQNNNEEYTEPKTDIISESVVDENKLIDEEGCLYEINSTIEFPNSELLIKRVKMKYRYDAGYLMYIDFDVTNKSDVPVSWRLQHHDNLLGYFNSEILVDKEIGGNDNSFLDDDTFDSKRKRMGAITLNPKETYSGYKLGIFLNFTKDIKEVRLKEKEPMQITLYFKENDVKHEFLIKLNDPS